MAKKEIPLTGSEIELFSEAEGIRHFNDRNEGSQEQKATFKFIKIYKKVVGPDGIEREEYDPHASLDAANKEISEIFKPLSGAILNFRVDGGSKR